MNTIDLPSAVSVRRIRNSSLRLLRGQDRGRLVEDQHVRPAVERAEDLHALLLADRDVAHPGVGVDRQPEPVGQVPHPLGRRLGVQQQPLPRLVGEHHVLGHRHDRDEHEVLEHHADAAIDGGPRRVDHHRLAVQPHLALVRAVEPVEDAHQRRLAGAVLAQQGVDLALAQVEIDAVVRDDRAESLGDAPQLEGERGLGAAGGYLPTSVGMSVISPEEIWSWTFLTSALERLAGRGDLAEADGAGLDVEDRVLAGLERPVLDVLGGVEHADVDLLERRRHHLRADVGLVGVDADGLDVLLLGGVERAEAALARDREDDLRALVDLVERDLLALRLVDEVLRVGD